MVIRNGFFYLKTTTIRSGLALLAVSGVAWSAEPSFPQRESDDVVRAWLSTPEARSIASAESASRDAASVFHSPVTGWAVELRREQGSSGGESFTTDVAGLAADIDWTGRSFLLNRSGQVTGEAHWLFALADLQEGACTVSALALQAASAVEEATIREEGQGRLDEVVRLLDGRVASGETSAFDLKRVQAQAERHRGELGAALASARGLSHALRVRAGAEVPPPTAPAPLPSWAEIRETALVSAPLLVALERQEAAASISVQAARRLVAPGLGLQGAIRRDATGAVAPEPGFEAGLVFRLPVMDGQIREIREERAMQERSRAELEAARAAIEERLAATWASAEALRADDRYAHHGADLWSEAWTRYLHGEGSLTELLDIAEVEEARDLSAAAWGRQVRTLDLELACRAGTHARALLESALETQP